jgi:hypothetical protein
VPKSAGAPHVAQNYTRPGSSAIDNRTTRHAGYAVNQRKRKRIEKCFCWLKTIALMRKLRRIAECAEIRESAEGMMT